MYEYIKYDICPLICALDKRNHAVMTLKTIVKTINLNMLVMLFEFSFTGNGMYSLQSCMNVIRSKSCFLCLKHLNVQSYYIFLHYNKTVKTYL